MGLPIKMPDYGITESTHLLDDKRKNVDYLIGVDIDNTLIFNDERWRQRYLSHCIAEIPHPKIAHNEISLAWDHFRGICQECFDECLISPDILLNHIHDPVALEVIKKLYHSGIDGFSIGFHLITARPNDSVEHSISWLKKIGFAQFVQAVTFAENKRAVLERIHAFTHIDDSYEVYKQLIEPIPSYVIPIFVDTSITKNIYVPERVYNWNEIEQKLRQIIKEKKKQ